MRDLRIARETVDSVKGRAASTCGCEEGSPHPVRGDELLPWFHTTAGTLIVFRTGRTDARTRGLVLFALRAGTGTVRARSNKYSGSTSSSCSACAIAFSTLPDAPRMLPRSRRVQQPRLTPGEPGDLVPPQARTRRSPPTVGQPGPLGADVRAPVGPELPYLVLVLIRSTLDRSGRVRGRFRHLRTRKRLSAQAARVLVSITNRYRTSEARTRSHAWLIWSAGMISTSGAMSCSAQ